MAVSMRMKKVGGNNAVLNKQSSKLGVRKLGSRLTSATCETLRHGATTASSCSYGLCVPAVRGFAARITFQNYCLAYWAVSQGSNSLFPFFSSTSSTVFLTFRELDQVSISLSFNPEHLLMTNVTISKIF